MRFYAAAVGGEAGPSLRSSSRWRGRPLLRAERLTDAQREEVKACVAMMSYIKQPHYTMNGLNMAGPGMDLLHTTVAYPCE